MPPMPENMSENQSPPPPPGGQEFIF